jgi:hypothetical protein
MAINAVIRRPNAIVANTSAITSTQSNPPIDLKNNPSSIAQNYLSHLLDVSIVNPVDGDVLTYNANTGKYDLAPVTATNVDGGTF